MCVLEKVHKQRTISALTHIKGYIYCEFEEKKTICCTYLSVSFCPCSAVIIKLFEFMLEHTNCSITKIITYFLFLHNSLCYW